MSFKDEEIEKKHNVFSKWIRENKEGVNKVKIKSENDLKGNYYLFVSGMNVDIPCTFYQKKNLYYFRSHLSLVKALHKPENLYKLHDFYHVEDNLIEGLFEEEEFKKEKDVRTDVPVPKETNNTEKIYIPGDNTSNKFDDSGDEDFRDLEDFMEDDD